MIIPMLVTDFLRRAVTQYGKKVGIVDGEKKFTYAQYGERVNRLSNGLLSLGIKKGDRVAVIDVNSHRFLEEYYGIPQIGAIILPINIRLSPGEVAYILNNSEARCLMVNEDLVDILKAIKDELRGIEKYILLRDGSAKADFGIEGVEYEELLSQSSPIIEADFGLGETDGATMYYTSGTTGHPKGLVMRHRNLYFLALNQLFINQFSDRSVMLHVIPLFHGAGWGTPWIITAVGGRHVILRQVRAQPICELIQGEKVTNMFMVPTMLNTLVNYEDLGKYDLSSLDQLLIVGSPLSEKLATAAEEKIGCKVLEGYGLTETGMLTDAPLKEYLGELTGEERKRKVVSAGFANLFSQIRVVNEKGEDVKPDGKEAGEVIGRSNAIADGYWKLPEETKRTWVNGWFHSGDMATIDEDGYITIRDRLKDMIISGGENIGSMEVENTINTHPAVLECAVVAAPHEKWGETPAAIVVLKEGQSLTEGELISYCKQNLGGFRAPSMVKFVDSLPKSGTGKVLKRELKEPFWQGYERKVA